MSLYSGLKKNKLLTLFLVLFSAFTTYGQISFDYLSTSDKFNDRFLVENRLENLKTTKYKKEFRKIYKQQALHLEQKVKDSTYIASSLLTDMIATLQQEISKSNPTFRNISDIQIRVNTSNRVNARCFGNGCIELNLGLMERLNSRAELCFVLCHEISHYLENHSEKQLVYRFGYNRTPGNKKKIEEIKSDKVHQLENTKDYVFKRSNDFNSWSRKYEFQADSLGMALFQKTSFKQTEGIQALAKLDHEAFQWKTPMPWKALFSEYTQKETPVKKKKFLFQLSHFESIDSTNTQKLIGTHPELDQRIDRLKKEFSISETHKLPDHEYQKFKDQLRQLAIQVALDQKKIHIAFYRSAIAYTNPDLQHQKTFYKKMIAKSLESVYSLKKTHTIGSYIPYEDAVFNSENLNKVAAFLHELQLSELENMIKHFNN